MRFYYYWYYTVYNIYYEVSKDVYFYLYANAMFSFLASCTAIWIISGINMIIGTKLILLASKYYLPGLGVLVYIINHFLFNANGKHRSQFEKHKLNRTKRMDMYMYAFSAVTVILFFVCMFYVRARYY